MTRDGAPSEPEVWIVAGGKPGAQRFGHLIQSLRRASGLSVDQVAKDVELSPGSLRAIEQGRRAPSERSGARLLGALLPDGSLQFDPQTGELFFLDRDSGKQIVPKFGAKRAGDNRRRASASDRPAPSREEAYLADLRNSDPERFEKAMHGLASGLKVVAEVASKLSAEAERPVTNEEIGAIVRSLVSLKRKRAWELKLHLERWIYIDSGKGEEWLTTIDREISKLNQSGRVLPVPEDWDSGD